MFPRLHFRTTSKLFVIVLALITSELVKRVLMTDHKKMPKIEPVLKELRMRDNKSFVPVIGILGQTIDQKAAFAQKKSISSKFIKYGNCHIPTSYVRWVETAGAEVVPIPADLPEDELREMFNSVNGLLFPGGAQRFPYSDYYQSAIKLHAWAVEANENGDYFPIWGTCLGFQLINSLVGNATEDIRKRCRSYDVSRPIHLKEGANNSRLLKSMDAELYSEIQKKPVGYFFHTKCLTEDMYNGDGILNAMNVLATNYDLDGLDYAALVEHKKYPFYGSQFHPEKLVYEWNPKISVERSTTGVLFNQYVANFFASEASKSKHRFKDSALFHSRKIDNYPSMHTMLLDHTTLTTYYFFDIRSYGRPSIDFTNINAKYDFLNNFAKDQITYSDN